jgi:hypothetical protein
MNKLLASTFALIAMGFFTNPAVASEPVPGAEIAVEQVPGPVVVKVTTGKNGEFTVSFSKVILTITPPKSAAVNKQFAGMGPQKIRVTFNTTKGPHKLILLWNPPDPRIKSNGGFAVSGEGIMPNAETR